LHKMRLPLPVVSRKRRQASRGEIKITTVVGARETLDRHLSVSETQNRRPVSETWDKERRYEAQHSSGNCDSK